MEIWNFRLEGCFKVPPRIFIGWGIYLLLANYHAFAQGTWQEYQPYSLALIYEDHLQVLKNSPSDLNIMGARFVYKMAVPYSDSLRTMPLEKKEYLQYCFKAKSFDASALQRFEVNSSLEKIPSQRGFRF